LSTKGKRIVDKDILVQTETGIIHLSYNRRERIGEWNLPMPALKGQGIAGRKSLWGKGRDRTELRYLRGPSKAVSATTAVPE